MRAVLIAGIAGILFGLGLAVSMMTSPTKVLSFLDIAGVWDPSLVFVLLGAIGTTAAGYRLARSRPAPIAATAFHQPGESRIDSALVLGSLIFGIGWGLVGYCPGPALAALTTSGQAYRVVAAMIAGMAVFELWRRVGRGRSG